MNTMNLSYVTNTVQLKTFEDNTHLLLSFKKLELKAMAFDKFFNF